MSDPNLLYLIQKKNQHVYSKLTISFTEIKRKMSINRKMNYLVLHDFKSNNIKNLLPDSPINYGFHILKETIAYKLSMRLK